MADVYLVSSNGKLACSNDVFLYSDVDGNRRKLFPHLIDSITAVGPLTVTAKAISLMIENDLSCFFVTRGGKMRGNLEFGLSKNVFLRQAQFRLLDDPEQRLEIAKEIVVGKVRNQFRFLQRHMSCKTLAREFKEIVGNVRCAGSLSQLRGFEGVAAHLYFSHMALFVPEWTGFCSRVSHPATDPFNATLSFLYGLLYVRVERCIKESGLDSMVGVLHELSYGRNSLTCDLVEEFRVALSDSIAFALFNRRQLKEDDFIISDKTTYPVMLGDQALKMVIRAFDRKMHECVFYPPLGTSIPYWKIMKEQVVRYRAAITGEGAVYAPMYFR